MTNMRRGFTMIELIFVIVIIGILAAVAIPKLAGTASKARISVAEGFVGTLNRSVGPAMWAEVVNSTTPGSVQDLILANFTDIPTGFSAVDLSLCGTPQPLIPGVPGTPASVDPATGIITPAVDPIPEVPATSGYVQVATIDNLDQPAALYCLDGTGTDSPKFGFDETGSQTVVYTTAP